MLDNFLGGGDRKSGTRAGFSIATAQKIIEHDDPDTIDQLLN